MSYEKHTWENGEIITAEKLNNIENGIEEAGSSGGGAEPLIVGVTWEEDTGTLSETWKTIRDAYYSGRPVFLRELDGEYNDEKLWSIECIVIRRILTELGETEIRYTVGFYYYGVVLEYNTDSENGYPYAED